MTQANYLLVDGVLQPDTIKRLYQRNEPLDIKPLYLGTPWAVLKDKGPILVHVPAPYCLIHEWYSNPAQRIGASILHSNASSKTVAMHLRKFLNPKDWLGNNSLLRFADPLVMSHWLQSYDSDHLSRILGPITELWVEAPLHTWRATDRETLQRYSSDQPYIPDEAVAELLGEPQLDALDSCHRWLIKERLYEWLKECEPQAFAQMTGEQIDLWLNRALDSAQQWGLVSEYALAIWIEICLGWGLEFANSAQGPYQRWTSLYPEHATLSPELRIEALDHYFQKTRSIRNTSHG